MTQQERRIFLLEELLRENPAFRRQPIPSDERRQKALLRTLMNLRLPKPASKQFLEVQDAYLQKELEG